MTRWSGLAPAVDAHLARWAMSERAAQIVAPLWGDNTSLPDREIKDLLARVQDNEVAMHWQVFSLSYGLPDQHGVPIPGVEWVANDGSGEPRLSDSPRTGTLVMKDGATISGREQFEGRPGSATQGMLMIRREYEMLSAATSHYVSAEVVDEVTWAAEEAFPEPLFETDLFTPAGFAVLEKPVQVVDLNSATGLPDPRVHVPVRAIGWHRHSGILSTSDGTIGDGVSIFLYTTADDYNAPGGYVDQCAAIGIETEPARSEGDFIPIEVIPWRFGVEWDVRPGDVAHHIPGTVPGPVAFERRWLFAFLRLCWQEIIVHRASADVKRPQRRRWERFAKRKELLDYTTLRLRRVVDPNYVPQGMGDPLDHRVLVRSHWRRVYVPSLGGPARRPDGTMDPTNHRLVWVERHWRGPEDAPLGAMHSATSVVR